MAAIEPVRTRTAPWRVGACCAFLALTQLAALPAHADGRQRAFDDAAAQYRAGRTADAFGRFLQLADAGDPDAARIVLFLLRYGPMLHGSYWDALPDDIAYWNELADSSLGRNPPPFRPLGTRQEAQQGKATVRAAPQLVGQAPARPAGKRDPVTTPRPKPIATPP
jgi:hypothetical protein